MLWIAQILGNSIVTINQKEDVSSLCYAITEYVNPELKTRCVVQGSNLSIVYIYFVFQISVYNVDAYIQYGLFISFQILICSRLHTCIRAYIHKMAVHIQEIQFLLLLSSDSSCSHGSLLKFTVSNYHLSSRSELGYHPLAL